MYLRVKKPWHLLANGWHGRRLRVVRVHSVHSSSHRSAFFVQCVCLSLRVRVCKCDLNYVYSSLSPHPGNMRATSIRRTSTIWCVDGGVMRQSVHHMFSPNWSPTQVHTLSFRPETEFSYPFLIHCLVQFDWSRNDGIYPLLAQSSTPREPIRTWQANTSGSIETDR